MTEDRRTRRDRWRLVGVFAVFIAALRPWRDFPVYDDWSYAYTVKTFLDGGGVRLSDWSSPTFLLQAAWGLLFCPGGFSHAALRLSTIVLSLASVALVHRWFLRLGLKREQAALGAAVMAVNPVFVNLSLSFMTDVPFMALCLLFFNLVTPGENGREVPSSLWACGLTAAAAALIRQPGALLALGYAGYLARRKSLSWRRAAALLGPPALALGIYEAWFREVHGMTWAHYWYNSAATAGRLSHPTIVLVETFLRSGWIVLYAGLAALPLTAARFLEPRKPWSAYRALSAGQKTAAAALLLAAAVAALTSFPAADAVATQIGLGRWQALGRAFKAAGPLGSPVFWRAAGLAGLISASVVVPGAFAPERKVLPSAWSAAPLVLWLFVGMEFFDRYLLMILPLLLLPAARGKPARLGWALCAALAAFAAAGELDYLNCHEAFWRASRQLEARGFSADSIWSTSEYVLWHGYQADMDRLKKERGLAEIQDDDWLIAAAMRRRAVVSFPGAPLREGYAKTGEVSYFSPLTMRRESLFIFEKR